MKKQIRKYQNFASNNIRRFLGSSKSNKGAVPGSLVFIGEKQIDKPRIQVISYNENDLTEKEIESFENVSDYIKNDKVTWINIYGLHDTELIKSVGEKFNIHTLFLEDLLNTNQRPKIEDLDDYLFFVLKLLYLENGKEFITSEQFSMIVSENLVITFQEKVGNLFEPVKDRIRKKRGRIRNAGAEYLAYALLDTIVDSYIYLIENLGIHIEDIEEELIESPNEEILAKINHYKKETNFIRKNVRPVNEITLAMLKSSNELISDKYYPFWNDLNDLSSHAADSVEIYREILNDQLNIYHTSLSTKMNDVMKVLTIFAAIFIPLTFIAGIYGMNFEYLPELHFKYSYFILWGIMITIAVTMLIYFKKKNWL